MVRTARPEYARTGAAPAERRRSARPGPDGGGPVRPERTGGVKHGKRNGHFLGPGDRGPDHERRKNPPAGPGRIRRRSGDARASYNTLHAVRQMGVDARHAGILGTGPWADTIRRVFESEGIRHVGPTDESVNSGILRGVHRRHGRTHLHLDARRRSPRRRIHLPKRRTGRWRCRAHQRIHLRAPYRRGLGGHSCAGRRRIAVSSRCSTPSPVWRHHDETFGEMVEYRPVWSCNEREAVLIAGRLGLPRCTRERSAR